MRKASRRGHLHVVRISARPTSHELYWIVELEMLSAPDQLGPETTLDWLVLLQTRRARGAQTQTGTDSHHR